MITRASKVLLVALVLIASVTGALADSAKDMLASGRVDEAISELNGKLGKFNDRPSSSEATAVDAESSNLLCRAYFALEDWDRAVSSCRKAVMLDPGNSRFHLWLGRVYGEKADRSNFLAAASLAGKVRGEFERAVQLNPNDIDARLDLAEFYLEAPGIVGGGEDKAREQARYVASLDPAREHWIYARIGEKKKDSATAEREYHRYI